ncbi:hypothetical protein NIES80_23040 [Dolichospermum planctonicum]|uniref:Uncharacterized protein n=1 Tax=Dolichospermum planctonicum TaxID=136072 RepID=A0A480AH43_9CYAN|nr:hypothetical protein NIES80_23040 [Dolichospermum planctonicum]
MPTLAIAFLKASPFNPIASYLALASITASLVGYKTEYKRRNTIKGNITRPYWGGR